CAKKASTDVWHLASPSGTKASAPAPACRAPRPARPLLGRSPPRLADGSAGALPWRALPRGGSAATSGDSRASLSKDRAPSRPFRRKRGCSGTLDHEPSAAVINSMMGRLWNLFLGRDLPRAAAVLRGHAAAVLPLDVLMLEDRILFSASAPDGGAPDADADSSHWDGDDGNADWNDFNDDASIEFLTDPDPLLGEPQDALARELVVIDPRVDHY